MGKKGKRSKQKDARKEADKIIRETDELIDRAENDVREESLYSKAANQYGEAIRLLESKKELMVYTRDERFIAYFLLMTLEYRRRNYKAALDCCKYIMAKSRQSRSNFRKRVILFHQLIMLRLNGQECQLSDFIHYISQEGKTEKLFSTEAVLAFRAHKMYDSAIRIEMIGPLTWSPLESKLSLALTYLERYRVEFRKRSEMRKKDFSTIRSLITPMKVEYPIEHNISFGYCLVVAQWSYLTHTLVGNKEDREGLIDVAQLMIEACLLCDSSLLPYSSLKEDKCYTCGQAATQTEVQYVCSGCRVACYCSIDHQRMTWKKEAVSGMRIGHEILCPLYKAHRKYKEAKKSRDEETESRMRRRFERECINFLEYGLGLKKKCFRCEYSKQKENNESPAEFVKKKPLSLDPAPSFYDQDSSDLTSNSVQETSRKIAEKAEAEYQKAFQASCQCQKRKIRLENEQKQSLNVLRVKSQLLSEKNRILANHEWQNLKKQFDAQQLGLKQFREFPPFQVDNPADTIAVNDKGETFTKANECTIAKMLKQVNQQLMQCEQTRAVKWCNFQKAKQEYESQLSKG